jgi:GT2 family glycosyltransferase
MTQPAPSRPRPATPQISIAIPLYEPSESFLASALESVRSQTLAPCEVVLTDDSDHPSEALVARLIDDLPATYIRNPVRMGMVDNWNHVVRLTSGTHVIVLHQDDALQPRALEVMAGIFADNPGVAIVGSSEFRIDREGYRLCAPTRPNHRERLFISRRLHELDYHELTYLMLRNGQIFGEPSAFMFDRARFDEVGGFDASFRQSVDVDFALRMTKVGRAIYTTDRLVRRRVHPGQATQINVIEGRNLTDRRILLRRHFMTQEYTREQTHRVRANLVARAGYDGVRALRHGRWNVLREAASQIVDYRPTLLALAGRIMELALWTNDDAR